MNNEYVRSAIAYAQSAIEPDQKIHGQRIVKAARRFLADLDRTDTDFYFDADYAFDACAFIEQIPHAEGVWEHPCIRLEPFQCFALVQLFGFRKKQPIRNTRITIRGIDRQYHARRFTSFIYAIARKNAKSAIAAGIALYALCREPEPGQQIYSAANTFAQAMPVFGTSKTMAEKNKMMQEVFGLKIWSKQVTRKSTGGKFAPLHAKASSQDGLNPSVVIMDEIHAAKTPDLLNVLTSAAGARSSPLFAYLTTEGYTSDGPWSELRGFSDKILDRVFEADHFLTIFFSVDPEDDDYDEACWIKANPLMVANPKLLAAIRKEAEEARAMPSKLAEMRIKRLNRESNPPNAWIDLDKWRMCNKGVTWEDFEGLAVYAGLDLSSTTDLCSFRIVARHPTKGVITKGRRWVPEVAVKKRTERGTAPYLSWTTSGLIETMPGEVIDNRIVREEVIAEDRARQISMLCGDPWNGRQTLGELDEYGIGVQEFVQGPKTYHPVMQEFERLYLSGEFAHDGDPVLEWCASNLICRYDVNLNMAPDKRRAPDKIDDMVALLMALGAMIGAEGSDISESLGDPIHG